MKNLNIKLVLVATVFSVAGAASANTIEKQSNLILAGKNHEQHESDDGETRSDTGITTSVKGQFVQEKLFGDADISAMSISVETTDGVVHLSGTADNQEQIDNAVKIAEGVEGVKKVVNEVKIEAKGDKDKKATENGNGAKSNNNSSNGGGSGY